MLHTWQKQASRKSEKSMKSFTERTKYILLLVLFGIIFVAPAHSLALSKSDTHTFASGNMLCRKKKQMFQNGTCVSCKLDCPDGQILNASFIITMGMNGAEDCRPCIPCPPGKYKTKKTAAMYADGEKCLPERNCTEEGMEFVRHTDGVNEAECGDCLPGYFINVNVGCIPCTKWDAQEPSCKHIFTTTIFTSSLTFLSTTTKPMATEGTHSKYEDINKDSKHHHVFGWIGGAVLVCLFVIILIYFLCNWYDVKKDVSAVCSSPNGQLFGSTESQLPIFSFQNDLETDSNKTVVYLTQEEENACKTKILEKSDKYICIVASKANCSLEQLYDHIGIPEHTVYQETTIWEVNERDIPEKIVNILNSWLHATGDGRTLFDLYFALKYLHYDYILAHLIQLIRKNIDNL